MSKKAILIFLILVCGTLIWAGTHDPWDGTKWDVASPDIDQPHGNAYKEIYDLRKGVAVRINKEHETLATSSAGGVHKQGSARAFFQDAAPTTQIDGTAWDSGDRGSFWFDTNATPDNLFYVLTDHASTGTWTLVSTSLIAEMVAAAHTWADAQTFSGLITANAGVTLGAGDDLIGSSTSDITINTNKFTVAGATGNTLVAGTFDAQGNIDPTTYETTNGGFLDEDAMGSDAADKVASQQSIKAYVDDITLVNGTATRVYTKYITGTLDADASTSVAHGVSTAATKIMDVGAIVYDNSNNVYRVGEVYLGTSAGVAYTVSYDATNVIISTVGADCQGQVYRIRVDYIL